MPDYSKQQKACIDRVREALPEFSQQDDYLLAHGASLMSDASHEIIHVDTLRKIVDAALAAARPMAAVPADLIEARAQGRAEALAIILGLDAESGLDECTESHPIADTGEYGTSWNESELRKLLRADDSAWSLLQEAEGLYWEHIGLRDEAEMRNRAVSLNEKSLKDALWLQVCELPDRNSPEGEPDACIVNREELATALEYAITLVGLDNPTPPATQPVKQDLTADGAGSEALSDRQAIENAQRERMNARLANRVPTPATADFDLPAPNDASPCYQCKGCGDNDAAPGHCVRCGGTGLESASDALTTASAAPTGDRLSQVATIVKDVIESLMLWNGQASAGLDVLGLAGLRDEAASLASNSTDAGEGL